MSTVALVLYVVALVVLFGVRSWVQHRRTGSTGFKGMGSPSTVRGRSGPEALRLLWRRGRSPVGDDPGGNAWRADLPGLCAVRRHAIRPPAPVTCR
jgi:hypothetical protein